jgi:small conductance mechanosensitive channel
MAARETAMMLPNLPLQFQSRILDGGINLVTAVLILAIGWTVARFAGRSTRFALGKIPHFDATLRLLLASFVRYGIIAVTIIAVLQRFGVETTSLIAMLGAVGLAVGLALQGTLSNVAAGVMILLVRPFRVGEKIESGGIKGTVREIELFRTTVVTDDMIYISIPNAAIFGTTITNYSREPTRRTNFPITLDHASDVERAQKTILAALDSNPKVLKTPAPGAPVDSFSENGVIIAVQAWIRTPDFGDTQDELRRQIKIALDAEDKVLFPQRFPQAKASEQVPDSRPPAAQSSPAQRNPALVRHADRSDSGRNP